MRVEKVLSMIAAGSLLMATSCRDVASPVAIQMNNRAAPAQVIEHSKDLPVDAVFSNPCCNEDVHVSGTAHLLITDNVMHVTVSGITGVGLTSGLAYDGRGVAVDTNIFYSNPFEGTRHFDLNLTNANGCGFKLTGILHITTNANGDVTAEVENVQASC